MRRFLLVLSLCCAPVVAEEAMSKKAYNVNEYSWTATGKGYKKFEGKGETSRLSKAWRLVQDEINALSRTGQVADKDVLVVTLCWKGKKLVREVVSHADHGPWPQEGKKP